MVIIIVQNVIIHKIQEIMNEQIIIIHKNQKIMNEQSGIIHKNQKIMNKQSVISYNDVNKEPSVDWIKEHPVFKKNSVDNEGRKIKVPIKYMSIERIEFLLTSIFNGKWKVEIKSTQLIANSIVVTVRLHYTLPHQEKEEWQDGIGAAPLQTKKDAGAINFNELISSTVMTGAPAAESYAIKDAAHKIGKIFGKDLNRSEDILFDSLVERHDDVERAGLIKKVSLALEGLSDGIKQKYANQINELEIKGMDDHYFYETILKAIENESKTA